MDGKDNSRLSPEEIMQAKYEKLKKQKKIHSILLLVGCGGLLLCGLLMPLSARLGMEVEMNGPVTIMSIIFSAIVSVPAIFASKVDAQLKGYDSSKITLDMEHILGKIFEVEEYRERGLISKDIVRDSNLISGWDTMRGSDYIKGKHREYEIQFSNVLLFESVREEGPMGELKTTFNTVFSGPWLALELKRDLPGSLCLKEKAGQVNTEVENPEFSSQFQIDTADEQMASAVLTSQFMEFLVSTVTNKSGQLYLSLNNNRICVTLDSHWGILEQSDETSEKTELQMKSRRADILYLRSILNELMKNDYLFGN